MYVVNLAEWFGAGLWCDQLIYLICKGIEQKAILYLIPFLPIRHIYIPFEKRRKK